MPINPPPTYRKPAMSLNGIDQLARGGVRTPNEIRRLHGALPLDGVELFVPRRSPERAHGEFRRRPFECISCGAVLKLSDVQCSYCHRPNPDHDHSMGALIEVTALDDPAPRYVPGWAPPRPLPPSLTPMAVLIDRQKPSLRRRRLVDAVLVALGLR